MYNPVATYRLQFNNEFTFDHLRARLSYLRRLGVKTIYASPVFAATPESPHGYDGVDPNRINPEIGTLDQLRALSQQLQQAGMGWLQDIVPNHMAYHPDNEWLLDILEKGPRSRFTQFFDTALASSFFEGRLMAPFLADSVDDTIAQGLITLSYERQRMMLTVGGNKLPLRPESYARVLRAAGAEPTQAVQQWLDQLDQLRHQDEPTAYALAWDELRGQLANLFPADAPESSLEAGITADALKQLVQEQHYRSCTELETHRVMSYRRFFAINGLICLNIADETVFDEVHRLTGTLVDEGVFQGLRVDHIDGLFDPMAYLTSLRSRIGDDTYVTVEKILQQDEALPDNWPVEGTSGYEFLATVNHLLTNADAEPAFRTFYHDLINTDTALPVRIRYRKAFFLAQYMGGELHNLHQYFLNLNLIDESTLADLPAGALSSAIGELLVRCSVYRYYGNTMPLPDEEADAIRQLLDATRRDKPDLSSAVDVLMDALLTKPRQGDDAFNERALRFYQRLMQFSGPLMAKGVEDTLLYTYNGFVAHNEVGDSPTRFGLSPDAFHRFMQERQQQWPLSQNATSTHDTKRGEDVRARLTVLTDLADEWLAEVKHWQAMNRPLKQHNAPDLNDEYFIYQNLLGAYPMPGQDEDEFPERFQLYLEKSLQEAKRHSMGSEIDELYYTGARTFVDQLLNQQGEFWARFQTFHRTIADFGITNSLVQLVLKMTCPGVPDLYQGCEGWHLSLVDPDNRRPVDFDHYQTILDELTSQQQDPGDDVFWNGLWERRWDGSIKLWLTYRLLNERRQQPDLFAQGTYEPLAVSGRYAGNVLAFARRHGPDCYVTIVPLYTAALCREQQSDSLRLDWQDTRVAAPAGQPANWSNCLTGEVSTVGNEIPVQTLFSRLPVALLQRH